VAPEVSYGIQSARGRGEPLPEGIRAPMERAFGVNFGQTRVHTDEKADALAKNLNARAFTTGSDIFFGKHHYNPTSSEGRQVLAHELTHVVQQGGASPPAGSRASAPQALTLGAAGDAYEQQADHVARSVSRTLESGHPAGAAGVSPESDGIVHGIGPPGPAPVGRIQRVPPTVYATKPGGKPWKMQATLTKGNIGGGTAAAGAIIPPGFKGVAPYGHHRGHLLAICLGGQGTTWKNLVALTPNTNSVQMKAKELAIRAFVKAMPAANNKVQYKVTANYGGAFQGGNALGTPFPATKWIAPNAPNSVKLEAKHIKKVAGAWVNQGNVIAPVVIKNGQ
jgi:hypothetical protein